MPGGEVFVWSAEVEQVVGQALLSTLEDDAALAQAVCDVCLRALGRSPTGKIAVSVGEPSHQLLFTHPSCMPSRVLSDVHPPPDETDAHAFAFVVNDETGRPHAYLAFEAAAQVWEVPASSAEPIDALISSYLKVGLTLVTDALAADCFPPVNAWSIQVDNGQISIWDEGGTAVYCAPAGDVPAAWFQQVESEGRCRILTGSGIGLLTGTFEKQIDAAIADGRVVGGTLRTTQERPHPPNVVTSHGVD